jgi:predicted ATPase/DNA-binding CsgD family transcriptional regulator
MSERSGFPVETTAFVGRRHEAARVRQLLSMARLVTLTGVGGVGKSRLAVRVARAVQATFPDGVRIVELARLREPSMLGHALVDALDLRMQVMREPEKVLAEYLGSKRVLLVLDNCDHLLEDCARLVTAVLPAARRTRILATSREPLRVAGEHVWQVPPFQVPSVEHQDGHEVLELFENRAAMVQPGFSIDEDNEPIVTRLCQRLDGLPLAIELAAVRLRTNSLDQIVDRLEDRYRLLTEGSSHALPRHRTLRAAVEWSYDLCSEQERILWARSSVFAGGFDLAAAEAVCAGEGLPAAEVLTAVAGLVDKSILTRREGSRATPYRMLETIRQYGQDRLTDSGEMTLLRRRHLDYYLDLAERAEADSFGPRQQEWFCALRAEESNLWAALDYSLSECHEVAAGLRMVGALWVYWVGCGLIRDGRHWLRRALDADPRPSAARARALWVDGWCACLHDDFDSAMDSLAECERLARDQGDQHALARAHGFMGIACLFHDDLEQAVSLLDKAVAQYREWNERSAPATMAFVGRANAACIMGDTALAHELCDECTGNAEASGERWSMSWGQWVRGLTWWIEGDVGNATVELRTSLRNKIALRDLLGIPFCVELLAWASIASGLPVNGAVLFGVVDAMWEPIGPLMFGFFQLLRWREHYTEQVRETLGECAYAAARRRGRRLSFDEAMSYAMGEPPTAEQPPFERALPAVTKRENDVAELVARGLSNQHIADRLLISRRTTEHHIEHLFDKLNVTNRAQLASWFARHHRE